MSTSYINFILSLVSIYGAASLQKFVYRATIHDPNPSFVEVSWHIIQVQHAFHSN